MTQRGFRLGLLAAGLIFPLGACKPGPEGARTQRGDGPLAVYTTFYPTTYFAERIGGAHVKVTCPCPADADPAFWMPDDATIAGYQQADLIVINGAAFEKWVGKVSLPERRVVDCTKPLSGELIEIKDAVTHSHGPSGAHTHAGIDGHTWVDPVNARIEAQQILHALVDAQPAASADFQKNFAALAADLDALNARMAEVTQALAGRTLLCSHPAYNYLARRHGWNVVNFHLDPGEAPADEELAKIRVACANQKVAVMLWEAEPLAASAQLLRERFNVASVVYTPGETLDDAQRATGVDYLKIMNDNVDRLLAALAAEPAAD